MGRLSMRKISEVFRQKFELKRSHRDIAQSLNVSVGSISGYLIRAKAAGLTWPLPSNMTDEKLYNLLFLPSSTQSTANRPVPDWSYICQETRKKGVTLQLLWREYRDEHHDGLGYAQFCRLYAGYKKTISPVMRQQHKAGEKTFVDYSGMKIDWINPVNGEIFTAEVFVGCLGASQLIYVEATATQSLPDWIYSHINMFEYFGGVTKILVPDNLRSGVKKAHRYDPDINPNYQLFSEHYGVAIVPARTFSAKDKAKVENAVGIVEKQILAPLRNATFTSLNEINIAIKKRLKIINKQNFQKMDVSRIDLFKKLDKPALQPLPTDRYQYAEWKKAKINIDYHFAYDDRYYSVHYKYIGKYVEIKATSKTIECFYKNCRIATHIRNYKKYSFTTIPEHMPTAHQEHLKFTPERLINWAKKIGDNTEKFIHHMIESRTFPQQAYRACLGLLRLSNKYGADKLEKACVKALDLGASRYQQVESILKNNLEEVPNGNNTQHIDINHTNIRGPSCYK